MSLLADLADTVKHIVASGMPVMGHIGLTPQSVHAFGGYRLRGKSRTEAERLLADARALGELDTVDRPTMASLAARIGKARLIDNVLLG